LDTNMANINDVERWLSLEEISKHVGCSKDTIPYHKVGRMYKFKISEVDAWIESGQSADADK